MRKIIKIIIFLLMIIFIISIEVKATSKIKLGDVNGDSKIDQTDLIFLLRHISTTTNKNHEEWLLTGEKLKAADITENNIIDISDVLALLRYLAANNSPEIAKKHPEWSELKEKEIEPDPESKPTEIEVTNIKLNKTSVNLYLGKSETVILKATIEPSNATNKKITWTSDNKNIATVDINGKVISKKNGTVKITAKSDNGKIATCNVTVITPASSIKLNKTTSEINLIKAKTATLKATISPSTASDKTVTWSSSNTKVATVDKNGKITAKKIGTATITATINGKKATCKVTVTGGYWEVKNGKYIYHYLDGTKKTWNKSEYIAWKKLKNQKVKALNPKAYKRSGGNITYAGITNHYYVEDETANEIAIKNRRSPYAITVDIDRKRESIFKINNGVWEPYKSSKVNIGKTWGNSNWKNPDSKIYSKDTNTPIGLYYINGNRSLYGGDPSVQYWVEFGVKYTNKDLGQYGQNGHGWNKGDYLHKTGATTLGNKCTDGCVTTFKDWASWIYYNCGRGTPVLIW